MVAGALASAPVRRAAEPHLVRAEGALLAAATPRGWGYNGRTAADADTTAWVCRFLARRGGAPSRARSLLEAFLGPGGAARTFRGRERFGSWAGEHADVTPVVGLALLRLGAPAATVVRVRSAVVRAYRAGAGWRAFWWSFDAYAVARSLEFLRVSGGVPVLCRRGLELPEPPASTPLERCARLAVRLALGRPARAELEALLAAQLPDGSFPPSTVLRVPSQSNRSTGSVHADCERLYGTAVALSALSRARAAGTGRPGRGDRDGAGAGVRAWEAAVRP